MKQTKNETKFYNAIWRWHFYSGIFVTPFLLILAVSGIMMMFLGFFDGRDGENIKVSVPKNAISISLQEQSSKVLEKYENAKLVELITAPDIDRVNVFRIKLEDGSQKMAAVDPYTGNLVNGWQRRAGWYDLA
ncbi:MAG: PepSY domain-containing protein, partial [Arcobacteraceae bacterium]